MRANEVAKLKKPEGQSDEVFKVYTDFLLTLPLLTNDQVASIHFESWDEARTRAQ